MVNVASNIVNVSPKRWSCAGLRLGPGLQVGPAAPCCAQKLAGCWTRRCCCCCCSCSGCCVVGLSTLPLVTCLRSREPCREWIGSSSGFGVAGADDNANDMRPRSSKGLINCNSGLGLRHSCYIYNLLGRSRYSHPVPSHPTAHRIASHRDPFLCWEEWPSSRFGLSVSVCLSGLVEVELSWSLGPGSVRCKLFESVDSQIWRRAVCSWNWRLEELSRGWLTGVTAQQPNWIVASLRGIDWELLNRGIIFQATAWLFTRFCASNEIA